MLLRAFPPVALPVGSVTTRTGCDWPVTLVVERDGAKPELEPYEL